MWGYRGFGKARWAAGVGWTGVSFEPGPAQITFTGYAPSLSYFFPPVRASQIAAEVWRSYGVVRLTQIEAEVYRTLDVSKARLSQNAAEVFRTLDPAVGRVSQIAAEVFYRIPLSQGEMGICALW
jgi:hypothetical protein